MKMKIDMNMQQAQLPKGDALSLPKGWEIKQWKDVLDIRSGRNQTQVENPKGKYPILGSAGKIMGFANDFICDEGTTIVGRKGTIDNPLFIESKFWNVDTAFGLHALDGLNKRFLFYFCRSYDFTKQDKGSGRPSLVKSDLQLIKMPLPSLPEQQRIVEIIDEAFAAIAKAKANAEQNLKNAKELFESYLRGLFETKGDGWEEKTLGEVCSLITDGKHGDCENETNSGYFFLSAKDVRNGTLLFDNARQITKSGFEETHRRTNLKPGDICMVNTGATIGRISFAPDDPKTYNSTFQKSVAVIKTIPDLINNQYCCYLLRSDLKKLVKVSSGTAVPNLLLRDLKKHKINLPKTLKAQQTIVLKLDALSSKTQKLEAIYQQKINDLEELKKSVLQKAFSGELTLASSVLKKEVIL